MTTSLFLAASSGAMIGILIACFLPIFLVLFVFKKKKNEKQ